MEPFELYRELTLLEKTYSEIYQNAKHRIEKAPEGFMRISHKRKHEEYYYKKDSDSKEVYLSVKDYSLAKRIAQRRYDESIVREIEKILTSLRIVLKHPESFQLGKVYGKLTKARKDLVNPVVLSDEEYISRWYSNRPDVFNSIPIDTEFFTKRGEHVRSKSELLIADSLFDKGIPYMYEYPVWLESEGRYVYADFASLNITTRQTYFWENAGLMDNPDYVKKAVVWKINAYQKNGIFLGKNLIYTFESGDYPLGTRNIRETIQRYLL